MEISIRPGRVSALPGQEFAYADLDRSGSFEATQDTTMFVQDEQGGGLIHYPELRDALAALGGTATGQQLAARLGHENARIEPAEAPPGQGHPLANGRFTLEEGCIRGEFEALATAPIIAPKDGNIATLDVNADGNSEPLHDSMLILHASDGSREYTSMVPLAGLQQVVQAAGGRVEERDFTAALSPLAGFCPGARAVWLEESTPQFDLMGVERTLRADDQGHLYMDYRLS